MSIKFNSFSSGMRKTFLRSTSLTTVLAMGLVAPVAGAEDGDDEGFDLLFQDITVTAQKRSESMQDVGIAMNAYTGRQMQALGLKESIDIIPFTSSVSRAGDIGGQRSLFSIRGVVQNDFADIAEAPVAMYIDEGYIASTQSQTFPLFDMSRIEVLKGPQGTLFGRNATGGLIHAITNKPTDVMEGYADFSYGSYNNLRGEAAISGPLAENITARVSGMYNSHDEIYENVYSGTDPVGNGAPGALGEDTYGDETYAIRAQFNIIIDDTSELLLSGSYSKSIKSESPYQQAATVAVFDDQGRHVNTIYARDDAQGCEALSTSGACIDNNFDLDSDGLRPVQGGDLFGYVDPDGSGELTNKDYASSNSNEFITTGFAGKYTKDFGWATLTSLTDYKEADREVYLDSDQGPTPLAVYQSIGSIDQFSQELRLNGENDKMSWVAGGYYLSVESDLTQGLAYNAGSPVLEALPISWGLEGVVLDPFEDNTTGQLSTKSYSLFGQVDYRINDKLTLVAGFRGGYEDKKYHLEVGEYANTDDWLVETEESTGFVPRPDFDDEQSHFLWSGKLQLEYKPMDNLLVYGGINRGVKAGSYNAKLFDGVTLADEDVHYSEEVLISYEAGFKWATQDGKTRVNGAAYYYDYQDYQAFTWIFNSGAVTNYDAEYKGFEIDVTTSPIKNFDIILGAAYTDATVQDVVIAPGVIRDTNPAFTPDWQFSGMARYAWDALNGQMSLSANITYQSSFFHNLRNFTAHEYDGYAKVDAGLSWDSDEGNWGATVFVNNLFDKRSEVIGFDLSAFAGMTQTAYARPRWVTASVRYNF